MYDRGSALNLLVTLCLFVLDERDSVLSFVGAMMLHAPDP